MGRYWVVIILAVISLAVGLVSRFWIITRPSSPWYYSKEKGYSQRSHYQDIPVLTTADAYWFTRYAKEHARGTYGRDEKDQMRQFPDGMGYPSYIPMISWITSCLHRITGMGIERLAFYLPPIMAVLFIIPLFAYSRYLGGPLPALGGALLGVTSISYVVRSSVGRFDTDCMNLFFMFLIGYLIQRAGQTVGKKGIIFAGLAGISFWLFDWWYYHPAFIVPFTFVFAVLLFLNRKKDQRHYWLIKLGVFLLLANPLDYYTAGAGIWTFVWTYVSPQPTDYNFPNVIVSVTEAKHFELAKMFKLIHSSWWVSVAGLIGLFWLIIRTRTKFLGLVPTLVLGLVALKGGNRFIMFLAPCVGLGIGLLASQLLQLSYRWIKSSVPRGLAGASAVIVTMAVCISYAGFTFDPGPKFLGRTYKGFKHLAELNQPGAVWTWWDWGYAIEHIGEQATYTDGGSYDKAYYVGLSLAQSDPQIAYNVILGVNNIGREGIYQQIEQRELDSGREVIKELKRGKYNAQPKAPIYVVYTHDMLKKFYWIYKFGTWNFDLKRGSDAGSYMVLTGPKFEGRYVRAANAVIDLELGLVKLQGPKGSLIKKIESTKIVKMRGEKDEPDIEVRNYKGHEGTNVIFEVVLSKKHGPMAFLMNNKTYESVFNQMFILNKYDRRFFQLIYNDPPYVKILKVKTTDKASENTVDQVLTTQQQLTDK